MNVQVCRVLLFFYLCGPEYDPVHILGATRAFFLFTAETDSHRPQSLVHAKEILMIWQNNNNNNNTALFFVLGRINVYSNVSLLFCTFRQHPHSYGYTGDILCFEFNLLYLFLF